ncbi:MAG: prohibitin family protein, partial [Methanococcaceae archaeon]
IILPAGLTASIEEKLKAEQESQRMEFVLRKETQEAERKRIEAQGISDFQSIVSKGLTNELLKWKGIEATEKLSNSANSKIIVIGSGKDGLPIILGNN